MEERIWGLDSDPSVSSKPDSDWFHDFNSIQPRNKNDDDDNEDDTRTN